MLEKLSLIAAMWPEFLVLFVFFYGTGNLLWDMFVWLRSLTTQKPPL